MIIPIGILFFAVCGMWLWIGIRNRNTKLLFALNSLLWLGAFGSGYFTYLCWADRGYSENWAGIGFLFGSMPYIIAVSAILVIEIICLMKLQITPRKPLIASSAVLLLFLAIQVVIGLMSI